MYRKTPVIYALTIPRPPLLLWCIYLFKVVPRYPGGGTPHMKGVGMLVVLLRGVNFGF